MKIFLTTVAGCSTRFTQSINKKIPKSIYYKNIPQYTLLYRMVNIVSNYDKIIIVGGYCYSLLEEYVNKVFCSKIKDKICLVYNDKFDLYGSGWSLFKGLERSFEFGTNIDEILFAEGDLYFSKSDFSLVKKEQNNVITINNQPIEAKKSVALYFDSLNCPHYIYDTSHGLLSIVEPFLSIYNSAQIWKFKDVGLLHSICSELGLEKHKGINLTIINEYFRRIANNHDNIKIIRLKKWVNCNTINDFDELTF